MQDGKGDVLFGTSVLGGFNRRNVLNYIEQLQNRLSENGAAAEEKLRQAQADLSALHAQIGALDASLAQADAEKDALRVSLDGAQKDNEALRIALERAQKENETLLLQLNAARDEAKRLRETKTGLRRGR